MSDPRWTVVDNEILAWGGYYKEWLRELPDAAYDALVAHVRGAGEVETLRAENERWKALAEALAAADPGLTVHPREPVMLGTVRESGGGWVAITVDPDTDDYPPVGERVLVMSVGPDTLLPCTPTMDLLEPRTPTVGERWRAWRERCRQDRERRGLAWHRIRGVPTGSPIRIGRRVIVPTAALRRMVGQS